MGKIANRFAKRILLQTLFWFGVWFYFMYFFSYSSNNKDYAFWFSLCLMPVTMITTYLVTSYLMPKYLVLKKYGLFALYLGYTLIISSYAIMLSIFGCFIILSEVDMDNVPPLSRNFWFVLALVYLVVGAVSAVRIMQLGYRSLNKAQALEKDMLQRELYVKDQELSYLKKQIQPHFLFNALNTIYSLSVRRMENTPEVILKLSNLLDYLLYQASKPMTSLESEVAHLKDYIALEKVRFRDTLAVDVDFDAPETPISLPPMLLLPFVENAFKHGVIKDDKLHIRVFCVMQQEQLRFQVTNTAELPAPNSQGGIGLSNLRKRLELLYPGRYRLHTGYNEGIFTAELQIDDPQNINDEEV
ncbi:sensor histidine kinase [Gilvibacter sediminis]|uniref:sensor histidine kinase n=1 Tax=Gilvibacter sediminis TaxID=379071 RepID=UPI0023509E32|nr:histidine kinase [Gilvibacter sediminis]MDC7998832.1 histidine kinase [Gilvibacter sediminis]